jgi:hypothetical protein
MDTFYRLARLRRKVLDRYRRECYALFAREFNHTSVRTYLEQREYWRKVESGLNAKLALLVAV